ncbi:hypothetical protein J3E64_002493 [Sphingobium sp. OAS761]|uniref:hypothetical protein n=1 Tax=Sphingobium sp. OAS761 TaxID=2817901 RepID=UPI0020A110D2|nr:hypothetical protein [Sphingobium sp. OAS761]MCP1470800.1 hypothetical protein [Sphingobium sp. OAS761]
MPFGFGKILGAGALACSALLAGCGAPAENGNAAGTAGNVATVENVDDADAMTPVANVADSRLPTDDWVGRWTGPEGLFLDIQPSPDGQSGHYAITNRDNLDRQADYEGMAVDGAIRFTRDGKDLTIRPGSGDRTGFKYLAGKQDCLIVISGKEGYCR